MSYRVNSSHLESLQDGRFVEPGEMVLDADAKRNPRLVERGILVKEPDPRKRERAEKNGAGSAPAPKPASGQEKKEEGSE